VRYMDAAVHFSERNFLVEDPIWAIDFAPNGKSTNQIEKALN
jgi:hypothetical protein